MSIIVSLPLNYTGFDRSRNKAASYSCVIEEGVMRLAGAA
jgi:hypothetical protein